MATKCCDLSWWENFTWNVIINQIDKTVYNGRTCLVVITPVTLLMLNFCRSPGVTMKAYVMTSSRSASKASTRKTSVSASASSFTMGAYREQSLNTGLRLLLIVTLFVLCSGWKLIRKMSHWSQNTKKIIGWSNAFINRELNISFLTWLKV